MAKTYRAYLPEQDLLLPPSLSDWLREDQLAYFVSDLVEQLDLSAIEFRMQRSAVSHLAAWAKALGEAVRSNPTKCQEQARQPCS